MLRWVAKSDGLTYEFLMTPAEMQKLLYKEIPLAQAMQISVMSLEDDCCELKGILLPNKNHKGTAFGGSLYSACALACYSLFLDGLERNKLLTKDVVIGEGNIHYLKAVSGDFRVQAKWPSENKKADFFKALEQKRKARIILLARVFLGAEVCCEFEGTFVAKL